MRVREPDIGLDVIDRSARDEIRAEDLKVKLPVTAAEDAASFLSSLPGTDSLNGARMPHQMRTLREIVREAAGNRILLPLPAPLALLRLLDPGTAELFGKYREEPGTVSRP